MTTFPYAPDTPATAAEVSRKVERERLRDKLFDVYADSEGNTMTGMMAVADYVLENFVAQDRAALAVAS